MIDDLSAYVGKTVALTGASGYIGSALTARLAAADCRLLRITRDRNRLASAPAGDARIEDHEGVLADPALWQRLLGAERADIVFHLAGQTSAYVAESDPEADFNANVLPIVRMLRACETLDYLPTVIAAGAVTQLGMTTKTPSDETAPDDPITIYDLHKLMSERYIKHTARSRRTNGAVLRLANVYGPGGESSSADRGILNRTAHSALAGEPITVYGDGSEIRDYIFIDDAVDAFVLAGANAAAFSGEHFLIGSGVPHSLADGFKKVAAAAEAVSGRKIEVRNVPWPAETLQIEYRHFCANTAKFHGRTGWTAKVSLDEGIRRLVESIAADGVRAAT